MSKLDYITVKGFKNIEAVEKLELHPINVIIGPNGSGKSNFIGVFSFLYAIRHSNLQDYVAKAGGADRILFFGSKETEQIYVHVSFDSEVNQYEVTLEPTDADALLPTDEAVSFWEKKYPRPFREFLTRNGNEAAISTTDNKIATYVRTHLDGLRVYHFHDTSASSAMKRMGDLNDNQYFRADGSNIAAYLYFLKRKHEQEYSLIRRIVQRVAPFFDDFILKPSALNEDKIRLEWKHKGSDAYFDISSLSDGSLRFIALATLLLQPSSKQPSVLLMDEPELGLHPYAITLLASMIKQASVNTQVILSTQSTLLLDNFEPEDVLVADRVGNGTQFTRLSTENLKMWLEEYSLGQLWEKNEFGGRPGGR